MKTLGFLFLSSILDKMKHICSFGEFLEHSALHNVQSCLQCGILAPLCPPDFSVGIRSVERFPIPGVSLEFKFLVHGLA